MKKLLIVLGLIVTFFASSAFVNTGNSNPGPGDACKVVGNCSVSLSKHGDGKYQVLASNNNSYSVTVQWTAIGYDSNGKERRVGSGTITCGPKGSDSMTQTSPYIYTSCEDVGLGSVTVLKCD